MNQISEYELKRLFPNASLSTLKANATGLPRAEPEQAVCHAPPSPPQTQTPNLRRFVVRITGFRKRLLDPDNFAGGCKYLVDGLRYAKLVPDDSPEYIRLETAQVKVAESNQERVEIVIEAL